MNEHRTRRRRMLIGIVAVGVTAVVIVAVTAALIAARSASQAVDDIKANQKTSDTRSAAATADREALLSQVDGLKHQNGKLSRQIKALVAYLKSQGIEVPTTAGGAATTSGSSKPAGKPRPKPKPSSSSTPSTTTPPADAPAPVAPNPAPTPQPLACILTLCIG